MEASIERVAREHLEAGIVRLFLRQAWTELAISVRKRIDFRRKENEAAVSAYCAMTPEEFSGINARQKWANWRTIPKSLRGRLPDGPVRAIDLCSGAGDSTEVLAHYLPRGSEILGLEFNRAFVDIARRRVYLRADKGPAIVGFRAQSVLHAFRGVDGDCIPPDSVDLVNSCGALGIHFDGPAIAKIAAETRRVLKAGGIATVDSGREGVRKEEMTAIFMATGFQPLGAVKSCFLDRFTQLSFVKR